MDIREIGIIGKNIHPWETARVKAVKFLLRGVINSKKMRVLDVGCGDGYLSRKLFEGGNLKSITGVDINLSDGQIAELSKLADGITYLNRYPDPSAGPYDLILLLDVLEHLDDDKAFLLDLAGKYLGPEGHILITVPAFQFLFGSHDRFLRHYRRYSLRGLTSLAGSAGLECLSSGHIFSSLLLPRFLSSSYEKIFAPGKVTDKGVGNWEHGRMISKAVELFLEIDNKVSIAMNKVGLKLPGLTVWILCKRRR